MDSKEFNRLLASAQGKFEKGENLNGDEKISVLLDASRSLYEEWTGKPLWHIGHPAFRANGSPSSPPDDPKKILLIQLYSVGDLVGLTPVLRGLREKHPGAEISVLTERGPGQILLNDPNVDDLFYFEREMISQELAGPEPDFTLLFQHTLLLSEELADIDFDLAVNMHYTIRHAIWASICGARYVNGITVDAALRPVVRGDLWTFYPFEASFHPEGGKHHVLGGVEFNLRRAGAFPGDRRTAVTPSPQDERCAERLLEGAGPGEKFVALNPDAGTDLKTWPEECYVELTRRLVREKGERVLLLGKPGAPDLTRRIVERAGVPAVDDEGKTSLGEVAALLKRCKALITGDTGVMHLAGAVGVPCLAFDGPTCQAPYGGAGHLAVQANIECMNCGPFHRCEIDKACLRRIGVDDALALYPLAGRTDLTREDLPPRFRSSGEFFVYWMDGAPLKPLTGYRWLNVDGDQTAASARAVLRHLLLSLRAEANRAYRPDDPAIGADDILEAVERAKGPCDPARLADALEQSQTDGFAEYLRSTGTLTDGKGRLRPELAARLRELTGQTIETLRARRG